MITKTKCKTALHNITKSNLPFNWDLNIYRGCTHNCQYCYAQYSHQHIIQNKNQKNKNSDFFKNIIIKENIAKILDKELSKNKNKKQIINLGGVCDSYQHIEKHQQIMPKIWQILVKHNQPIIISTKSNLILSDIKLIKKLSEKTFVTIAMTITTQNEKIANNIESGASTPNERFETLKILKQNTKAKIGLHIMPIIPELTDNKENLENLFQTAKKLNLEYIITGGLYLKGETKPHFLNFIKQKYPNKYEKIKTLYQNNEKRKNHFKKIYTKITELHKKYEIPNWQQKVGKEIEKLQKKEKNSKLNLWLK